MNPLQAVEKFWSNNYPVLSAKRALVAVSGGADSLALLHALLTFQANYPQIQIEVAHINHKIRGEAATADADFVAEFCRERQVKFHLLELNVPKYAQQAKISLEDAARRVRYDFFAQICHENNLPLVLTAHTADDQAETVLMRLLRGSGLAGLAGIPPLGNLPTFGKAEPTELKVGRPLLSVYRAEIEKYCAENHLAFRRDETNFAPDYTRNKIRLELLPLLQELYQPAIKPVLNRLAGLVRDEEDLLTEFTQREFADHAQINQSDKLVAFERTYWQAQSVALQRRLLRQAWQILQGDLADVSFETIETARLFADTPHDHRQLLAGDFFAFSDKLQVGLFRAISYATLPPEGFLLSLPGKIIAPDGRWTLEARLLPAEKIGQPACLANQYHAWLDCAKIGEAVVIRHRKAGERYRPLGANGRRKVQDIMVDVRIPREKRAAWPLVAHSATDIICWIPGALIADEFKIGTETTTVLELIFTEK